MNQGIINIYIGAFKKNAKISFKETEGVGLATISFYDNVRGTFKNTFSLNDTFKKEKHINVIFHFDTGMVETVRS